MLRKVYIAIILIIALIGITLITIYDNTEYESLVLVINNSILILLLLVTAYLLIVKKRFEILAGINPKDVEKIKASPEDYKTVMKTAKIMGYICIYIAIVIAALIYTDARSLFLTK